MAQPLYKSTDVGAPVIDNTAGSLCATLDAVLVNGYGSKAPLGWSIKFTAANRRVYKMGAGTGFELGVDEIALTYAARVRPAESYTAIDTFTNGFPTAAQMANGIYWQKTDGGAGAKPWVIVGDRKRFLFMMYWNPSYGANCAFFGDIISFKPGGDPYACMIFGMRANLSTSFTENDSFGDLGSISTVSGRHYLARAHTGIGTSLNNGKYGDTGRCGGYMGSGNMTYPDPITGGIHLSRVWVGEPSPTNATRGYIPGLWVPCHNRDTMISAGVAVGDSFSGSDGLSSRTFEFRHIHTSSTNGGICFETSDWPESA